MSRRSLLSLFMLLVHALPGVAGVGDTANYNFRNAPLGSLGVKGFEELRGKPVLVDFWGTR